MEREAQLLQSRRHIREKIAEGRIKLGVELYVAALDTDPQASLEGVRRCVEIFREELVAAGFECSELRTSIDPVPRLGKQFFAGVTPIARKAEPTPPPPASRAVHLPEQAQGGS